MPRLNSLADFASGPSTGRQAARLLAELFRLPWPCTPSLHPLPVVFRDGRCVRLLRTLRGHRDCQSLVNLGKLVFFKFDKFQIPNSKFGQIKLFAPKSRNPRLVGPRYSRAESNARATIDSYTDSDDDCGDRSGTTPRGRDERGGSGGGKAPPAARVERDEGPRGLVG